MESMNKVLVLVGMGPGVSAAVARRFAREGYAIGAVARSAEKLELQMSELRASGFRAVGAAADAGDIGSLRAALDRLQRELGEAGVLIYNAAGVSYQL